MKSKFIFFILMIGCMKLAAQTNEHPSSPAFTITERDAHLECISYAPSTHSFFLGSIHKRKIIRIDNNRAVTDFITGMQDSFYSVLGITVDDTRNLLWVCTTALPEMQGYSVADKGKSSILKFNLQTGRLIKKYLPLDNEYHVLGEPLVASNGDVYISDSGTPNIYRINKNDSLELFLKPTARSLQGIAFDKNEDVLFFSDYSSGLYRCNIKTKETLKLTARDSFNVKGVDGLYFFNNSLIAIQNGLKPAMICQYFLDKDQRSITSQKILEKDHPAFNEPTCGTIVKGTLYYIANSQWSGYDKDHKILPVERLEDIKVLKLGLNQD